MDRSAADGNGRAGRKHALLTDLLGARRGLGVAVG
jgi:hypothetical protein